MMHKVLVKILVEVLKKVSSEMLVEVRESLEYLEKKAKETDNVFDDFLVKILKWIIFDSDE